MRKAVGFDHFIRSLPDGYDTVLDDKSSLSQGQKQLAHHRPCDGAGRRF